jgi:hypothetical protein
MSVMNSNSGLIGFKNDDSDGLSDWQVSLIRELAENDPNLSHTMLAQIFDVSRSHITNIVNYKRRVKVNV